MKKTIDPLDFAYAKNVATNWPDLPHAKVVMENLPAEVAEMLSRQDDSFLKGWYNAVAIVHDFGIKALITELVSRTGGTAQDGRDILVTKVGAVVEGLSYVACKELLNRHQNDPQK